MESGDALTVLKKATGRTTIPDALSWLGDGHPIEHGSDLHEVVRALVFQVNDSADYDHALRRIARLIAVSHLDTATVLFGVESIVPAAQFARSLHLLASRCPGGTLARITPSTLIRSQREDPFALETLAAVAGLSYNELAERVPELPATAAGPFTPSQLRSAFATVDSIVRGEVTTTWPGAIPAMPIELLPDIGLGRNGWEAIEDMRTLGVPYEVLLAQRAAGGAWLAHRNRTSNKVASFLADALCQELKAHGAVIRRSTSLGGETTPKVLGELTGCDKQLGLVVVDRRGNAKFGVIFSVARDSGTASKNASRLRGMRRPSAFPIAIVVAGPGWAARNETAELAASFGGRLYSDIALEALVEDIMATTATPHEDSP